MSVFHPGWMIYTGPLGCPTPFGPTRTRKQMFRKLHPPRATTTILVDGRAFVVDAADTVAAALLGAGLTQFRPSSVSGSLRGPYCMMGVCFDCRVTIDDIPDRQACLTPVIEGMRVRTVP